MGIAPDHAQIAEAAFYLWLEEGRPQGKAEDHWHRAAAALTAPRLKETEPKQPQPKKRAAAKRAAAKTTEKAASRAKAAAPKRSRKKADA